MSNELQQALKLLYTKKPLEHADVINAYRLVKAATYDHDPMWAYAKIPDTWINYRLQTLPDFLLDDPITHTTWFPVFTEKQDNIEGDWKCVPADLLQVFVYVSDCENLTGVVIDPYTYPMRIPMDNIKRMVDFFFPESKHSFH